MIELILGGARSGKSRYAEQCAENSAKKKYYLATAQALDNEMAERIRHHQQRRDESWQTIEESIALADKLEQHSACDHCIVVDCLTLWLSNALMSEDTGLWQREKNKLLEVIPALSADVIFVSNEVGVGIVPMGELSRRFVDETGWLHQDIARLSDKVVMVIAGLPQILKDTSVSR